ncbi:hypothetical protein KFE25_008508 [Diacronema lutheri]|uniref:Uncharacterized protein n=1 Tax=Diacronema lutheri TaxID=2081491 RepID=A0A8J5XX28_DIALT|nr:hypothetical protein KFE25_008508 [Diacronema lutheri]
MVYLIPPGRGPRYAEQRRALLAGHPPAPCVPCVGEWARALPERPGHRSAHDILCRCAECRLVREHPLATGAIFCPPSLAAAGDMLASVDVAGAPAWRASRLGGDVAFLTDAVRPPELTAAERMAAAAEFHGAMDRAIARLREHLDEDHRAARERREAEHSTRRR